MKPEDVVGLRRMIERQARNTSREVTFTIEREPDEVVFGTPWTMFTPSEARPPREDDRSALRQEEQAARRKVDKYLLKAEHAVAWEDVRGNATARQALMEVIEEPTAHKELYAAYGMTPSKGVLLCGPPGCGKTMLGKACATALARLHGKGGAPTLLHINGPEIESPFIGVTEQTIRDIFAYARAFKALHGYPLLVFIDEADAIVPSRERSRAQYVQSTVATFLTEMDGLETSGAFVVMATNRPDAIDAAILRDGRCDRKVYVERPDQETFADILEKGLARIPGAAAGMGATTARMVFADFRVVRSFESNEGPVHLLLSHLVSGAMAQGMVQRIKAAAFRRDRAAGVSRPSGLITADLEAAVDEVETENRTLAHAEVIAEIGRAHGLEWVRPSTLSKAGFKTGFGEHAGGWGHLN